MHLSKKPPVRKEVNILGIGTLSPDEIFTISRLTNYGAKIRNYQHTFYDFVVNYDVCNVISHWKLFLTPSKIIAMKSAVKYLACFGIPLFILVMPLEWIPLEAVTLVEKRVIAIFFLAALCWVLEPIPVFATSILIILLELLMISNGGIAFFMESRGDEELGELLTYQSIMAAFASPIILLFLGGFFLAMAATKYRLDINLARVLLKPFGTKPAHVMLGLMVITAVFSMFMSNTATTAMMLAILAPVMTVFAPHDLGRKGFALCIPLAANLGGIGTPIGTPPNVIALKYLTGTNEIPFGTWMSFGVPFVVVSLLIGWFILNRLFKTDTPSIELNMKGKFLKNPKAYIVYVTFTLTILLWLTGTIHGINSYVVAMIPVGVFVSFQIITKEDLKRISWDVLWLVSGGIALGLALDKSGLARNFVNSIPFEGFSPYAIIVSATLLAMIMANFMSHTATANLMLPIISALGASLPSLAPMGGERMLILAVTFSSSLGLALPISTPPNALAHGTGFVETRDMSKVGMIMIGVGFVLVYLVLLILKKVNFY